MSKKRSLVHPKYKTLHRLRNWGVYDRALVRRGDLTIWFDEAAIFAWELGPQGTRGRPRVYSALDIETALALRLVYGLPWRHTEGLLRSLIRLLGLRLRAPDHTTLSRRARAVCIKLPPQPRTGPLHVVVDATGLKIFGQGEWAACPPRHRLQLGWSGPLAGRRGGCSTCSSVSRSGPAEFLAGSLLRRTPPRAAGARGSANADCPGCVSRSPGPSSRTPNPAGSSPPAGMTAWTFC